MYETHLQPDQDDTRDLISISSDLLSSDDDDNDNEITFKKPGLTKVYISG